MALTAGQRLAFSCADLILDYRREIGKYCLFFPRERAGRIGRIQLERQEAEGRGQRAEGLLSVLCTSRMATVREQGFESPTEIFDSVALIWWGV